MKRTGALVLVVAGMAVALGGCGGRTDGLSDDEITPAPPMLPAYPGVPSAPAAVMRAAK